jgi:F0F1-type ATP synthase epsilon subunit
MKEIMHFNSTKERLDYLRGGFNEIVPKEVVVPKEEKIADKEATEVSEASSASKPKKATKKKGKKKDDKVQAE